MFRRLCTVLALAALLCAISATCLAQTRTAVTFMGAWASGNAPYAVNDQVTFSGGVYNSLVAANSVSPVANTTTANWQFLGATIAPPTLAPVTGVTLTKTSGVAPNAMPTFQLVSAFRQFAEIGNTYFLDALTPTNANVSYFANQSSTGDLGILTRGQNGYQLSPEGGLQEWGTVYEYKRLETAYDVGTVTVAQPPVYSGTGNVIVYVALTENSSNWLEGEYNLNGNMLELRVNVAGTVTVLGAQASASPLQAGDRLSLVLDGPFGYVLQTKMNGAQYRSGVVNLKPYIEFRLQNNSGVYNWGFGQQSIGNTNVGVYRNFFISWFGGVGLRDFDWVKYEDGSPYSEGGLFYFLADVAGVSDNTTNAPYASAYQGVFTFDPVSYKITEVGRILWQVQNAGSFYVVGDQAGQAIFDRDHNYWLVSATSFGSSDRFGTIGPVANYVNESPLVGTRIIFANQVTLPTINYPTATNTSWDHYWTKMTVGGVKQWEIALTASNGSISSPVLCNAPEGSPFAAASCAMLTQSTGVSREGTKIVNTGNGVYTMVAGETNTANVYTYSISPFAQTGSFTAPLIPGGGQPAQHADMIANYSGYDAQYYYLVFGTDEFQTFNNSWGTLGVARNAFGNDLVGVPYDWTKAAGRTPGEQFVNPSVQLGQMAAQNGLDYYWTDTGCATGTAAPANCTGTTHLPGPMVDASYQVSCQIDSGPTEPAEYTCSPHSPSPLPTASGSALTYHVVQVMANSTAGTYVPVVYFHAHHN